MKRTGTCGPRSRICRATSGPRKPRITRSVIRSSSGKFVQMVKAILDRGVAKGVFRKGVDPVQLNITIAAIGYYYLNNRFTGSIVFERDYMSPENLDARLAFNVDTILRLVRKAP